MHHAEHTKQGLLGGGERVVDQTRGQGANRLYRHCARARRCGSRFAKNAGAWAGGKNTKRKWIDS